MDIIPSYAQYQSSSEVTEALSNTVLRHQAKAQETRGEPSDE